jgi:hypothetical protein
MKANVAGRKGKRPLREIKIFANCNGRVSRFSAHEEDTTRLPLPGAE